MVSPLFLFCRSSECSRGLLRYGHVSAPLTVAVAVAGPTPLRLRPLAGCSYSVTSGAMRS